MTAAVIQLQRRAAARTAAAVQLPPQNDIQGFETYTSPLNGGQRLRMNCRGFEDFVSLGSVGNALDNGRGELKTCHTDFPRITRIGKYSSTVKVQNELAIA